MRLVTKKIYDTFYQALNVGNEAREFHGKWVCISLDEWKNYTKEKSLLEATCLSTINFDKHFTDFLIKKINASNYGAGSFYEIYEQRRQEEIEIFLSILTLSDNEISYFKDRVEYIEDNGSLLSICDSCGDDFPHGNICLSLQLEGKELCNNCLSLCF